MNVRTNKQNGMKKKALNRIIFVFRSVGEKKIVEKLFLAEHAKKIEHTEHRMCVEVVSNMAKV